jgi:hypothetical protein
MDRSPSSPRFRPRTRGPGLTARRVARNVMPVAGDVSRAKAYTGVPPGARLRDVSVSSRESRCKYGAT